MKKNTALYIMITLILTVTIGGLLLFKAHRDSLLIFDTDPDVDIDAYLPFSEDEGLHNYYWRLNYWEDGYGLDQRIIGELPVLNGSEHFFSIYSGIVNALYPETTTLGDGILNVSTSEEAFCALVDGSTDIFFGFQPSVEMLAYAQSKGVELKLTHIATEQITFIFSKENPVEELSREDIIGIFTGTVTNWNQIGGADAPILLYHNSEHSDAQWALTVFMDGKSLAEPKRELRFSLDRGFYLENTCYRNSANAIGYTINDNLNFADSIRGKSYASEIDPITGDIVYDEFELNVYAVTRADNDQPNVQTVLDWITGVYGQYFLTHTGFSSIYYDSWTEDALTDVVDTAPSIRVDEYMPFRQDTKIVKLDHEASLRLTEYLPKVDGAAAVFPVYSAFVNAVYPEGTRFYKYDYYGTDKTIPSYSIFVYSNTVNGYRYLAQRNTDIFFGGYPSDEQIAYAEEQGTQFVYTPIGYDAFVFFVHKDNPIDSLTSEQVRGIYSGAITNWSQVGGHDEEIVAYQRNEGSGSQSRLIRFMGDTPLMEPEMDTRISDMMGITTSVAQFRSSTASIGFSFRYYMEALVANPDLKLLAIDGIAPTTENIANGTYPLTNYLYAVSWADNENENVQKLLDWILSPEGQYIISETGYVPIGPTE